MCTGLPGVLPVLNEKAVELVTRMGHDFDRIRQIPMKEVNKVVPLLRNREFDRYARDFLMRHPDAVVVHVGCGLDTRFERVDNGSVVWYDLDLPEVIALRRKLIGGEGEHYHLLACSVLDSAWLDTVSAHRQRPFLFLAEGVLMYLTEAQVKLLVLTLKEHFPGAELVFDAFSPFMRWAHNFKVTRTGIGAHLHWGLKNGKDLERWSDPSTARLSSPKSSLRAGGIRLLDERPEEALDRRARLWVLDPSGERVAAPFEGKYGEPNTFGGYLVFMLAILLFIGVMVASTRRRRA